MKQWSVVICCLSALLLMQDVRLADCQGEVRDMQGRPIVEALIVYTNTDNGKTYRIKTDRNGQYHMIGLMLGWYNLEITGPTGKHIYSGKKVSLRRQCAKAEHDPNQISRPRRPKHRLSLLKDPKPTR